MNSKQAWKAVRNRKRVADLEEVLTRAKRDIRDYNACIDHMIDGGSPCDFCEDKPECLLQAKIDGKGCDLWMLRYPDETEDAADDS